MRDGPRDYLGQRIKAAFGRAGEERVVVLSEEETDQVHAFLLLR